MKKIIDGKMYNTKTAELLHEWDNGYGVSDFKSCEEELYKTKNGAYFIAGKGGPMSAWAEAVPGSGYGYGSGIKPISEAEAVSWLETHEGDEVLLDMFADKITEA
jgi:hypothetical protein